MKPNEKPGRLSRNRTIRAFWSLLNGFGPKGRANLRSELERQITVNDALAPEERSPVTVAKTQEARDVLRCLDEFERDLEAQLAPLTAKAGNQAAKPRPSGGHGTTPKVVGRGTGSYAPPEPK